ncbi:hypothetical protein [Streptomyces sp. NPDC054849]
MLIFVVLVGTVVPLIWLPYLGFAYHQSTNQLAESAVTFYFSDRTRPLTPGVRVP